MFTAYRYQLLCIWCVCDIQYSMCVCVCVCVCVCYQEEYDEWNRQLAAANAPRQPNIIRFQHPGIDPYACM